MQLVSVTTKLSGFRKQTRTKSEKTARIRLIAKYGMINY